MTREELVELKSQLDRLIGIARRNKDTFEGDLAQMEAGVLGKRYMDGLLAYAEKLHAPYAEKLHAPIVN